MSADASTTFFGRSRAEIESRVTATEEVLCPLCGVEPIPFATDYQGFRLCRCPICRLEFVSPRLSYDQLAEGVYAHNYFPARPETKDLPADAVHYFSSQLAKYEELAVPTGRRILDIGCGNGAFLAFASEHGWEIAASDIFLSDDAKRLGCKLWEGRLQDIDLGGEKFDVVRLNHVLEHAQEPINDLRAVRQYLKADGVLHVSVPNIGGLSPRLKSLQSRLALKSHRWRHYAAMHHLYFYTPESLTAVVERAGFQVVDLSTPVPKKDSRNAVIDWLYRVVLERTKTSSIVDVYCRPA